MWVYGDAERQEDPAALRKALDQQLRHVMRRPAGIARHAALVGCFIKASELVQGVADAEFEARGCDARTRLQDIGARLLLCLARSVRRSWQSGFDGGLEEMAGALDLLPQIGYPAPIRVKRAEGYALYALYPESYLEAAQASGLGPDTCVIGIRSIGTGLAALAAAALEAPPPITVRPIGDPFRRSLAIAPELAAELASDPGRDFAVVDEGPGLSGSSFGAVADWLETHGIARERIHFFPGHGGDPGGQASEAHLQRWHEAQRHVVSFQQLLMGSARTDHKLSRWLSDLLGLADLSLHEISGGAWRERKYGRREDWPPVFLQQEKPKFLTRAGGTTWLVKFAGLGEEGERKYEHAKLLSEAGFTPAVAGLCHGFLVERWLEAKPLDRHSIDRSALVDRLGHYLGFRAAHLPAPQKGASVATLTEMARYNTQQALGPEVAARLDSLFEGIEEIEDQVQPVFIDGRLHPWEWLVDADGSLWKTDALDHNAAHDLVGCQDIAWDVAGALVEHALTSGEVAHLLAIVESAANRAVSRRLVEVLVPCYLAFQLGLWTYAAQSQNGEDAERAKSRVRFYADELKARVPLMRE